MWNGLSVALSFLTVFHLPGSLSREVSPRDLVESFSFYPLVGLLMGGCCAGLGLAGRPWVPPLLLAVGMTGLLAGLARGLHLDGLADLADGVGGGYDAPRRLEIMKDSSIGTFGATALILALLFKVAAFEALVEGGAWRTVILAPALSRLAMVWTAYRIPYARSRGGMARPFLEGVGRRQPLVASGFALVAVSTLEPWHGPLYVALTVSIVVLWRRLALRWLGGVTGDVLGAVNEVVEVVLLVAAACLAGQQGGSM